MARRLKVSEMQVIEAYERLGAGLKVAAALGIAERGGDFESRS